MNLKQALDYGLKLKKFHREEDSRSSPREVSLVSVERALYGAMHSISVTKKISLRFNQSEQTSRLSETSRAPIGAKNRS